MIGRRRRARRDAMGRHPAGKSFAEHVDDALDIFPDDDPAPAPPALERAYEHYTAEFERARALAAFDFSLWELEFATDKPEEYR